MLALTILVLIWWLYVVCFTINRCVFKVWIPYMIGILNMRSDKRGE